MPRLRFSMLTVLTLCVILPLSVSAHDKKDAQDSLLNPLRKYHEFKALKPFGPELRELTDKLIQEGQVSEIAVYFRSFNDGVWIGVNEKERFAPASLMKVPVMMAYLKHAEKDPGILNREFEVETEDQHSQFVPSSIKLKKGEKRRVEDLIETMIRGSNNDAMATLVHKADVREVVKLYNQLGYADFVKQGDFLSLKAYAGTFRVLYNATYLNEAMSEKALRFLSETEFKKGIPAGLPSAVKVAHKFGEYGLPNSPVKQLHDVGIVYHHENPYLIGIMTRGDDYDKLAHAIETVSSFIYTEVDRQYKASAEPDFDYQFEQED